MRYFTRSVKRRSRPDGTLEDEHSAKRIRALLAQLEISKNSSDEIDNAFSAFAFPAQIVCGIEIPQSYNQAINDKKWGKFWRQAIDDELIVLVQNGTWKQVLPPVGVNLISTKWVFNVKTKIDGAVERFKARLVARGFSQKAGEDYHETFAPTVRIDTLRIVLAVVAAKDLECSQFDIKNAFTESMLKEKIFAAAPQVVEVKSGHVLQLLRSLYGLKQAARDWNLLMKRELIRWGFTQSLADPCMFSHPERPIMLLVYVDDIVAASKTKLHIDWFFNELNSRFNAKNLGEIHKILGVRVTRKRTERTIFLDQSQYISSVLEKFGMMGAEKHRKVATPVVNYNSLRSATNKDIRIDVKEYQKAIGSLMFAMILTRPDIAFAMGKLSQYMSDPAEHHGHALKHLMRYLRSTVHQKIRYGPGGVDTRFLQYTDADWASD
ncbi:hypothetical protein K3495_g13622, partial [Podosphaera aphanis]